MTSDGQKPVLRVVSAAYPGPTHPRRAHFIADLHRRVSGYRSEILAPRVFAGDPLSEETPAGRVQRFPYASGGQLPKSAGWGPRMLWSYVRSALDEAEQLWPDGDGERGGIVLAHWVVPAGWIAQRVARRLGLPLVLYGHGSDLHRFGRYWPVSRVVRRLLRAADRTVVASAELARIASEISGRPVSDFPVIPVGIDDTFLAEPHPPPSSPPPWRLLFVGDHIEEKGIGLIIEAVEELRNTGLPVELTTIGDGPLRDRHRAGFTFLGEQNAASVRKWMASSALLLLPSFGEGTPLVVQEAIAMRLPVLATGVGGIPDLFQARTGWYPIQAPPSRGQLTGTILEIIQDGPQANVELRRSMSANPMTGLDRGWTSAQLASVLDEVAR